MGRHRSSGSNGQRCRKIEHDLYEISWVVDFYYPTSRLRFPRTFRRHTDEKGARKFCKKWDAINNPFEAPP
jgi:hypothetical protein